MLRSFFVLQKLVLVLVWFICQKPAHIAKWGENIHTQTHRQTQIHTHTQIYEMSRREKMKAYERGEKNL